MHRVTYGDDSPKMPLCTNEFRSGCQDSGQLVLVDISERDLSGNGVVPVLLHQGLLVLLGEVPGYLVLHTPERPFVLDKQEPVGTTSWTVDDQIAVVVAKNGLRRELSDARNILRDTKHAAVVAGDILSEIGPIVIKGR